MAECGRLFSAFRRPPVLCSMGVVPAMSSLKRNWGGEGDGMTRVKQLALKALAKRSLSLAPADPSARAFDGLYQLQKLRLAGDLDEFLAYLMDNALASRSQRFQDLLVLYLTGGKQGGYFVEFGAADGVTLSNTWALEMHHNWTGVLAEPSRVWAEQLSANRGVKIDLRCVHSTSGLEVEFEEDGSDALLSGLANVRNATRLQRRGPAVRRYTVETVSLDDLLRDAAAPQGFDYLSVDTEGTELEILSAFDLGHWRPSVVTVETNENSAQISKLFTEHGYRQIFSKYSGWDNWYVRSPNSSGL